MMARWNIRRRRLRPPDRRRTGAETRFRWKAGELPTAGRRVLRPWAARAAARLRDPRHAYRGLHRRRDPRAGRPTSRAHDRARAGDARREDAQRGRRRRNSSRRARRRSAPLQSRAPNGRRRVRRNHARPRSRQEWLRRGPRPPAGRSKSVQMQPPISTAMFPYDENPPAARTPLSISHCPAQARRPGPDRSLSARLDD